VTLFSVLWETIGMPKEDDLNALLDRAKELKEIGEKLIKQSEQLMGEYEVLKTKKQGKAQMALRRSKEK
jgi:hypothetical protein